MGSVTKPLISSQINWGHPLAKSLVVAYLLTNSGWDTASNALGTVGSTVKFGDDGALYARLTTDNLAGRQGQLVFPATTQAVSLFSIVRPDLTGASADCRIINMTAGANSVLAIITGRTNTKASAIYRNSVNGLVQLDSVNTVQAGTVYSVAGTAKQGLGTLYLNGKLELSNTTVAAVQTFQSFDTTPFYIGAGIAGAASNYSGTIRLAYAWARELSANEILWLHTEPYAFFLPQQSPIAYFFNAPATPPATSTSAGLEWAQRPKWGMMKPPSIPLALDRTHPLNQGLVMGYPFLEGAANSIKDMSGYGTHLVESATIGNNKPKRAVSRWGAAAAFDGINSSYESQNASKVVGLTDLSILTLVRPDVIDLTGNCILNLGDDFGGQNFMFLDFLDAGGAIEVVRFVSHFTVANAAWRSPPNVVSQGVPVAVGITYRYSSTSDAPKIYINGLPVDVTVVNVGLGSKETDVSVIYVGTRDGINTEPWNGQIADVRIWNRLLTDKEMLLAYTDLYNTFEPPRARWKRPAFVGTAVTPPAVTSVLDQSFVFAGW